MHRTNSSRHPRVLRTVVTALAAAGLLVSGCSSGSSTAEVASMAALPVATPKTLAPYYGQKLNWHRCGMAGFDCATMKAPLDYADPGSGDVRLAVARKKATGPGKRLGSLLVNPGGPGGSAIGYLQSYAAIGYPAEVRARYDMVGVDPRGVARSEPVTCMNGKQMDAYTQTDVTPDDRGEQSRLVASFKNFAQGCRQRSTKLLAHVSTVEAARDMDILRAVLGDRKLNYVGASYGTFLGATYAGLYPERSGRLVLDGAMDPSLSARRTNIDQTAGFETAFQSFAKDCVSRPDCPLSNAAGLDAETGAAAPGDGKAAGAVEAPGRLHGEGTHGEGARGGQAGRVVGGGAAGAAGADGGGQSAATQAAATHAGATQAGATQAAAARAGARDADATRAAGTRAVEETTPAEAGRNLKEFFQRLDRRPLSTDASDRKLGEALATTGVIAAMYDEGAWSQLRAALSAAIKDQDGSGLLTLSDSYYERRQSGGYENLMFANSAVNCLDLPAAFRTPQEVEKAVPEFEKASSVFGTGLAWASLNCAYWPVRPAGRPHRIEARGAAPIVVVGTTRDPATPYAWARSLASQLDSGTLLTYEGDGHTAYGRGSTCIDSTINRYLLSGTAPKTGKRCS